MRGARPRAERGGHAKMQQNVCGHTPAGRAWPWRRTECHLLPTVRRPQPQYPRALPGRPSRACMGLRQAVQVLGNDSGRDMNDVARSRGPWTGTDRRQRPRRTRPHIRRRVLLNSGKQLAGFPQRGLLALVATFLPRAPQQCIAMQGSRNPIMPRPEGGKQHTPTARPHSRTTSSRSTPASSANRANSCHKRRMAVVSQRRPKG